jgi:glycerol kinase
LYNTGTDIIQSQHGLLTTVGYQLGPNSPATYALEGSISTAGSGLDWLKSTLEIEASTKEVCAMAETVPNSGGVCFVPSFNGILAPRWRPDARAVIIGLSFATKMPHIIRALVESIAFQGTDVLKAMALDAGAPMPRVKVDGGLSKADLLLQIQADSLGATVDRPADIESTARGAAFAAGVAVGLFPEDSTGHPMLDQPITSFTPKIDETIRSRNQRRWDKAVERSLDWAQEGEYEDEIGQQ